MKISTLTDLLLYRSRTLSKGITFIENDKRDSFVSYRTLKSDALRILDFLQKNGVGHKNELVFQIEDNRTFVTVFWACILGGIIPVPLTVGHKEDHILKLFEVWKVLEAPFLITTKKRLNLLEEFLLLSDFKELALKIKNKFVDISEGIENKKEGKIIATHEDDIAFIQFSSGSTGKPKGVILTHKNLIVNTTDIGEAAKYTSKDSMLSWMPLTHDMGLIGFHINPLLFNMNQFLIPTSLFVRRPAVWLDKATEYNITILSSPNFGYSYVIKNCLSGKQLSWDLSGVRILYNGAEPISEKLAFEFLNMTEKYGMKQNVMCPVYGLAEATLAVSMTSLANEVRYLTVSRDHLNLGGKVKILDESEKGLTFVNVGKPIKNCSLRIADDEGLAFGENTIGKVLISGPSITSGYYNNSEETAKVIKNNKWLNTGDQGFLSNNELYLTGRTKDIIFSNGQNYYPHDLERIAEAVGGVELNKIVFCGLFNEAIGKDDIIAFVFYRGNIENFQPLASDIKSQISQKTTVTVDKVIPVKNIPRTTSGKLQRFKLLELYSRGAFKEVETEINNIDPEIENLQELQGPTEKKLHQIWKEIFENRKVGVHQDFFELGGNSLKAAEMLMKVWREFRIELPLEIVYGNSTIKTLAIVINQSTETDFQAIPHTTHKEEYTVSSAQKRLYYNWDISRFSLAYNIPVALKIVGALNISKLEKTINMLIERHEILRSYFIQKDFPTFSIEDRCHFKLKSSDFNQADLEGRLKGMVKPFDLNKYPLFRIELLQLKKHEFILFLDFHHIISDGMSIHYFIKEMMVLYHDGKLKDIAIGYKDYAAWESIKEKSKKTERKERFWSEHLKGDLPILELPTDFERPASFDSKGAKIKSVLPQALVAGLREMAIANNCSVHVLLLAIYRLFLAKYTGQDENIIGLPVSVRNHPDLLDVHGMFVNNLALKNFISPDETFLKFLCRENNIAKQALEHSDFYFERIVQKFTSLRDISRNPIFDTMFVFQNMEEVMGYARDIGVTRHFFDHGISKFDVSVEFFDYNKKTIEYYVEYSETLFERKTMVSFSKRLKNLISDVLKHPDRLVGDFSIVSETEHNEYVHKYNDTFHILPNHATVDLLFELQAKTTPKNIAIEFNDEQLTYEELNDRINSFSKFLVSKGIGKNKIVGLLLNKSPELIIAIMAVLKVGASFLPIDDTLPEERITYIIAQSKAALVLVRDSSSKFSIKLKKELHRPVIDLGEFNFNENQSSKFKSVSCQEDQAYVLYTSGTTGHPKGVIVGHYSLTNYVIWASNMYYSGASSSFPLFTSISFDLTLTSIFVPLATGNKIVIYDEDPGIALNKIIYDDKVNIIKLTPSHLKILKNLIEGMSQKSTLKKLIVGGELLETSLANSIFKLFKGQIKIYNEYGPTEATVGCMVHCYSPQDTLHSVPIGTPISNSQIYLLDSSLKPVPKGVHGNIYISGACLSKGYLFEEDLTDKKFIENPFVKDQLMYVSGDIAKRLPTGGLEYMGRIDQQVKFKGFRIELMEIEQHLRTFEGLNDCAVMLKSINEEDKILIAYYTTHKEQRGLISAFELNGHLALKVPYYMIPTNFMKVESIPLTNNGKVDHNALGKIQTSPVPYIRLPEGKIEKESVLIWEDVLRHDGVGVYDNFYELGGDSIKALQIATRLKERGILINAKDILTYHTIEQISLQGAIQDKRTQRSKEIIYGKVDLSPIQFWFLKQKFANPNFYNQSMLLKLDNNLDSKKLEISFEKLVEHHDELRLNFSALDQKLYYNEAHLKTKFNLEEYEISNKKNGNISDFCHSLKKGFDLERSLLFRAAIIRDKGAGRFLFITAHHLLVDGISWRIILEDLYAIYKGKRLKLPQKTATYAEWTIGLQKYSETDEIQNQKKYWNHIVNKRFSLPLDNMPTNWNIKHSRKIKGLLNRKQTIFLRKEAHNSYKTNVLTLLNVALVRTLRDWTSEERFVVEMENHGRHIDTIDVGRTLGWFTSMYPLILELNDNVIGENIKSIKEQLKGVPNHGLGHGLHQLLGNAVKLERVPIRFNYLGEFEDELNNDLFSYVNIDIGSESDTSNHMTAELEFNTMILNDSLHMEIIYNHLAHTHGTMDWLLNTFFDNLKQVLNHVKMEVDIHYTPSDFVTTEINQEELDSLFE